MGRLRKSLSQECSEVSSNHLSRGRYLKASADTPRTTGMYGTIIAGVVGGAVAVTAVPVVLGAAGFTGTGIAAASIAAKMMSAAAVANGGGVAAGSLVATLQSVGMGGLSITSYILLGSSGSALGAWLWS